MAYYDDLREVRKTMARMRRLEAENERIVVRSQPDDSFRGGRKFTIPVVRENTKPYARPPKPTRAGNGS
jgi:hypothetical protein